MLLDAETLKKLLPGMFNPGGVTEKKRTLYLVVIGTRLYFCTDFKEIVKFGLQWGNPLVDMFEEQVGQDVPLQLVVNDIRMLRV